MPNIQASLKKKILRGNNLFMTRSLRKVIIRSRQRICFNKTESDENWSLYKTQEPCAKPKIKPKFIYDNKFIFGELFNRISQTKTTFLTKQ